MNNLLEVRKQVKGARTWRTDPKGVQAKAVEEFQGIGA